MSTFTILIICVFGIALWSLIMYFVIKASVMAATERIYKIIRNIGNMKVEELSRAGLTDIEIRTAINRGRENEPST